MDYYTTQNPFLKLESERLGVPLRESFIAETYGQHNEDLLVEAMLRPVMGLARREMADIHYIEIGANHPIHNSTTYLLYRKYGARGILVEPLADLCQALREARPGDMVVNTALSNSFEPTLKFFRANWDALSTLKRDHLKLFGGGEENIEELSVDNLHINDFLGRHATRPIDFLSIDTEGNDADLIAALDLERFRPTMIQCEPGQDSSFILLYLTNNGYKLIAQTEANYIFLGEPALVGMRI